MLFIILYVHNMVKPKLELFSKSYMFSIQTPYWLADFVTHCSFEDATDKLDVIGSINNIELICSIV